MAFSSDEVVTKPSIIDTVRSLKVGETKQFKYDDLRTTPGSLSANICISKKEGRLPEGSKYSVRSLPNRGIMISRYE